MKTPFFRVRRNAPLPFLVVGVWACLSFNSALQAQTASLDAVVVSASRTEQRLQDAMPATTLITRADIDAAMASDLPTLLRQVAGVEVAQNGGPGALASSFIRGAEARHTLVLIDGVAVNDLNFGTAALEHLSLDNVDHIEVVRGNVSALYGSAALGGVIQVFTRQGGTGSRLTAQVGTYGQRKFDASVATRLGQDTQVNLSMESLDVAGFNALNQSERPGTNPDRDGYARRVASLAVVQSLGALASGAQPSSLSLRLRESRGTTHYDSEYGPATQADESRYAERGAAVEGKFNLAQGLSLNAAWTRSEDDLNANVTAYPYFINSISTTASLGAQWRLGSGQVLSGGLENTRQEVQSDTSYNPSSRTQNSFRLGYQGEWGAHQVQLDARQDRYASFGSATTYYAGYAYRITDAWRVNASSSTGFNAPTFNDLYYPYGGNASLRPERVKSAEVGLQYAVVGQEFRAILFNNRYRDLIGNDANYDRVNINSARNQGLELSYQVRWGHTALRASATSQDPVDLTSHKRLSRRAAEMAKLGLSHDAGPWSFNTDWRYNGSTMDGSHTLAAYSVLDIGARYTLAGGLSAQARVDNVADRNFESVYGYRQAGRTLQLGLIWQTQP